MIRIVQILIVVAVAVGAFGAAAIQAEAAGPTNSHSPNALLVPLNCGSAGIITVAVVGNGNFGAAHEVGTQRILIPTAFSDVHGTFTPPGGTPQPFTEPDISHPGPKNQAEVSECSFHLEFSDPVGGSAVIDGMVTGFIAPGTNR